MGGTEVYVEALAREQQRRGVDVVIVAPGRQISHAVDAGLPVRRFSVSPAREVGDVYGEGDEAASSEFARIVDQEEPQIVHLHAFTSAVSAKLAHAVRRRGIRLVFTYHTPTVSCQRGTLMRWGTEVCDGKLDVHLCARCTLHGLGLNREAGLLLGAVPSLVGLAVGKLGLAGGGWTALRMTRLVEVQHAAFRSFMGDMDGVVVLCQWAHELLMRNGIPGRKIRLSRHGLPEASMRYRAADVAPGPSRGPLRIAFLGRLHPTKGADILLRALATMPDVPLELHIFGIAESADGSQYEHFLRSLAANDARVSFFEPVKSNDVPLLLSGYDLLAVPSRWLETGPLVVLEASAAGVPVLGSRLGGIAELVKDGVNGLLVAPDSVEAWAGILRQLSERRELLSRLRTGVRPPRLMEAVAEDMLKLYDELLHPNDATHPLRSVHQPSRLPTA
jgi:glycosyltransferase involved in cell wall biosynthesis